MFRQKILVSLDALKEGLEKLINDNRTKLARNPEKWGALEWTRFIDYLGPLHDKKPPISDERFAHFLQMALANLRVTLGAIAIFPGENFQQGVLDVVGFIAQFLAEVRTKIKVESTQSWHLEWDKFYSCLDRLGTAQKAEIPTILEEGFKALATVLAVIIELPELEKK